LELAENSKEIYSEISIYNTKIKLS